MGTEVRTNVIKRNGEEVKFDSEKIVGAIQKANHEVAPIYQMNNYQIEAVADKIAAMAAESTHAVNV